MRRWPGALVWSAVACIVVAVYWPVRHGEFVFDDDPFIVNNEALWAQGGIDPADIDESHLAEGLSTHGIPDPDLVIRTSGEKRISNFLLWQSAYSELVFVDKLWPDFDKEDLAASIREYQQRDRRYGAAVESG